jgi:predicted methyltransferase
MRHLSNIAIALSLIPAIIAPVTAASAKPDSAIMRAVGDMRRSEANRARDVYRHPLETLSFFDVRPGQTVAEFYPGGGWYTEILAPMLKDKGTYIAIPPASDKAVTGFTALVTAKKDWFGPAIIAPFSATDPSTLAPGSVDRVLTFRNVHNLMMAGDATAAKAFHDFYAMLKHGGMLGVEDHRLPEDKDSALERSTGYVKKSTIIHLAEAAGFKFAGESKVNANPKDTHDWPQGVWTLPPTYKMGDVDRDKYAAIGESDRLTLKFIKP